MAKHLLTVILGTFVILFGIGYGQNVIIQLTGVAIAAFGIWLEFGYHDWMIKNNQAYYAHHKEVELKLETAEANLDIMSEEYDKLLDAANAEHNNVISHEQLILEQINTIAELNKEKYYANETIEELEFYKQDYPILENRIQELEEALEHKVFNQITEQDD